MKFTAEEVDVMRRIKIRPVWRKECELTGDSVFCEFMYVVDGNRFFRMDMFNSKTALYNHCFGKPVTVQQIIERNLKVQLLKAIEKAEKACGGLKKVTEVACSSENWNPATEALSMEIIVAAENALREAEGVNS